MATSRVVGVQPSVLRWARTTCGYTIEEAARKIGREASEVSAWENGVTAPTYAQLEALAYDVYRRPIAVFYLPSPPDSDDVLVEFRSAPTALRSSLRPSTRFRVRHARALQLSLVELHAGKNPQREPIFRALRATSDAHVESIGASIRQRLGTTIEDQRACPDDSAAFKWWRDAVEGAGVSVFKNSFKQPEVSGFCLHHEEFPVIYLNNSQAKTRQCFTLLHELAHILLGESGITALDPAGDPLFVETNPLGTEGFCNAVAAETLLPQRVFAREWDSRDSERDAISFARETARRYRVSFGMVLRRLLDAGRIDRTLYLKLATATSSRGSAGGGDFYATQVAYLGERFIRKVLERQGAGQLTLEEASEHLGVKPDQIARLEAMVYREQ